MVYLSPYFNNRLWALVVEENIIPVTRPSIDSVINSTYKTERSFEYEGE